MPFSQSNSRVRNILELVGYLWFVANSFSQWCEIFCYIYW